jgi:phosphoribosyl-ATP pyrophosphohydrolase/phosphoribosyl-AMP cyclohydrolase
MKELQCRMDWEKGGGLIPAVVQDVETNVVLMLGYMNEEAFEKTLETQRVWFYSRSKGRLWMKGETSGNILELIDIKADCDYDALLIKALPHGPTCHTGALSCFNDQKGEGILDELYRVIVERKLKMPEGSYTTALFGEGMVKICAKVKEESDEIIQAAQRESKRRVIEESVDVLYHLFVLLVQRGVVYGELLQEVRRRRRP